jgi:hypothetical protein
MPEELIPIILFISLFTYLSIATVAKMFGNMSRTKSNLRFMQGLVDRGFSASEIERVMRACRNHLDDSSEPADLANLNPQMTRPVPPVKPTASF